jgi:hypothetical protein
MNYQGDVWQEIFLERHYTNAAPQRSLLNQGSNCGRARELHPQQRARTTGVLEMMVNRSEAVDLHIERVRAKYNRRDARELMAMPPQLYW